MRYRTILLFGAPGAGKGTQGKILSNAPGFFHCACGDIFRNRLEAYERETQPVVEYYGRRLIHRIDSDRTPVEVCQDILSKVIKPGIQPGL